MKKNKLTLIIVAAIAVLVIVGIWLAKAKKEAQVITPTTITQPSQTTLTPEDTSAAIAKDLEAVSIGEFNKDFEVIDKDINSL